MGMGLPSSSGSKDKKKKQEESQLSKITRDSNKISVEATHGLISQVLKNVLFTANPHEQHQESSGVAGSDAHGGSALGVSTTESSATA